MTSPGAQTSIPHGSQRALFFLGGGEGQTCSGSLSRREQCQAGLSQSPLWHRDIWGAGGPGSCSRSVRARRGRGGCRAISLQLAASPGHGQGAGGGKPSRRARRAIQGRWLVEECVCSKPGTGQSMKLCLTGGGQSLGEQEAASEGSGRFSLLSGSLRTLTNDKCPGSTHLTLTSFEIPLEVKGGHRFCARCSPKGAENSCSFLQDLLCSAGCLPGRRPKQERRPQDSANRGSRASGSASSSTLSGNSS